MSAFKSVALCNDTVQIYPTIICKSISPILNTISPAQKKSFHIQVLQEHDFKCQVP